MLKLFIDTWMIQSFDWRIFYAMSILFVGFFIYQVSKMIYISVRLKMLETKYQSDISRQLDDMWRKIDAGLEVKPSKYLK
jgi:hypothetical protein